MAWHEKDELPAWCKRVRRDILALEIWAKQMDPGFEGGGAADESHSAAKAKNENMKKVHEFFKIDGDPGDPPDGPYE